MQKLALELSLAMQRDELADADVAERLGVDRSTVSRWVTGKARISRAHHAGVAEILGVDAATATMWAASVEVRPATVTGGVSVSESERLSAVESELDAIRREVAAVAAAVRELRPRAE